MGRDGATSRAACRDDASVLFVRSKTAEPSTRRESHAVSMERSGDNVVAVLSATVAVNGGKVAAVGGTTSGGVVHDVPGGGEDRRKVTRMGRVAGNVGGRRSAKKLSTNKVRT